MGHNQFSLRVQAVNTQIYFAATNFKLFNSFVHITKKFKLFACNDKKTECN